MIEKQHECPTCGAKEGKPCRTPKGRKKDTAHNTRPFSVRVSPGEMTIIEGNPTPPLARDDAERTKQPVQDCFGNMHYPPKTTRKYVHELRDSDAGKRFLLIGETVHDLAGVLGFVRRGDVGKRLYLVGDILQVENDEQFEARTKAGEGRGHGGYDDRDQT